MYHIYGLNNQRLNRNVEGNDWNLELYIYVTIMDVHYKLIRVISFSIGKQAGVIQRKPSLYRHINPWRMRCNIVLLPLVYHAIVYLVYLKEAYEIVGVPLRIFPSSALQVLQGKAFSQVG